MRSPNEKMASTATKLTQRIAEGTEALIKERGAEPASLIGWLASHLPFGAGAKYTGAATEAYRKARKVDKVISGPLSRIPFLGGAFRTVERLPGQVLEHTPAGPIRELTEVPSTSLIAPLESAQKFVAPMLAMSGIGAMGLGVSAQRERNQQMSQQQQPTYGQYVKAAAELMREREQVLEKVSFENRQRKVAMDNLTDEIESLQLEKEAAKFVVDLVRGGQLAIENFEEKVAEIVAGGKRSLDVHRAALTMIDKDASSLGVAEDSRAGGGPGVEDEGNPVLEYLEQYAYAHDA